MDSLRGPRLQSTYTQRIAGASGIAWDARLEYGGPFHRGAWRRFHRGHYFLARRAASFSPRQRVPVALAARRAAWSS